MQSAIGLFAALSVLTHLIWNSTPRRSLLSGALLGILLPTLINVTVVGALIAKRISRARARIEAAERQRHALSPEEVLQAAEQALED